MTYKYTRRWAVAPLDDLKSRSYQQLWKEIQNNTTFLGPEEEARLVAQYQKGDTEAGAKVISTSVLLFHRWACQYANWRGVSAMDLFGECVLGAYEAAQKYDPSRGARFISFAFFFMLRNINRYTSWSNQMLSAPAVYSPRVVRECTQFINEYLGKNQHEPTIEEVIEHFDGKIARFMVEVALNTRRLKLATCVHTKNGKAMSSDFVLENHPTKEAQPDEDAIQDSYQKVVRQMMATLNDEDRYLFERRGIDQAPLKEISKEMGMKSPALSMRYNRIVRQLRTRFKEVGLELFGVQAVHQG